QGGGPLLCDGRRVGHGSSTGLDPLSASLRIGDSEGTRRDPRPNCPCLRRRVCLAGCRCRIDRADSRECLVMGAGTVYVRPSLEHTPTSARPWPLSYNVADAARGFCEYLSHSRPTAAGRT